MPGFVLREQVDPLSYNFEPFGPSGEISEPSGTQVQNFRTGISELMTSMIPTGLAPKALEEMTSEELSGRIQEFIGKDRTEENDKIMHIVSEVCSGDPSYDVLCALPFRHQQAFVGWLTGVLLSPPALTPATNG